MARSSYTLLHMGQAFGRHTQTMCKPLQQSRSHKSVWALLPGSGAPIATSDGDNACEAWLQNSQTCRNMLTCFFGCWSQKNIHANVHTFCKFSKGNTGGVHFPRVDGNLHQRHRDLPFLMPGSGAKSAVQKGPRFAVESPS